MLSPLLLIKPPLEAIRVKPPYMKNRSRSISSEGEFKTRLNSLSIAVAIAFIYCQQLSSPKQLLTSSIVRFAHLIVVVSVVVELFRLRRKCQSQATVSQSLLRLLLIVIINRYRK